MNINKQFDRFYENLSAEDKQNLMQHIKHKHINQEVLMEGYNSGKLAIFDGLNAGPAAKLNLSNTCNKCGKPL